MKREFNAPNEMFRRLIYVMYVGCLCVAFCFSIMGVLGGQLHAVILAAVFIPVALLLKQFGVRHLEFKRLGESFPMGSADDALSTECRSRFVALVDSFHSGNWTERQEIRKQIEKMVREQPILTTVYEREIAEVHPTFRPVQRHTDD